VFDHPGLRVFAASPEHLLAGWCLSAAAHGLGVFLFTGATELAYRPLDFISTARNRDT
jgi:hypothetical protein